MVKLSFPYFLFTLLCKYKYTSNPRPVSHSPTSSLASIYTPQCVPPRRHPFFFAWQSEVGCERKKLIARGLSAYLLVGARSLLSVELVALLVEENFRAPTLSHEVCIKTSEE